MDLIERTDFLKVLHAKLKNVTRTEGHCVLVSGEAGIGKSHLLKLLSNDLHGWDIFKIHTSQEQPGFLFPWLQIVYDGSNCRNFYSLLFRHAHAAGNGPGWMAPAEIRKCRDLVLNST